MQDYPVLLHPQSASHPSVNANSRILDFYVNHIVPGITEVTPGSPRRGPSAIAEGTVPALDDGNYGSAATRDVEVLQALSRRIHFGEFGVGEQHSKLLWACSSLLLERARGEGGDQRRDWRWRQR